MLSSENPFVSTRLHISSAQVQLPPHPIIWHDSLHWRNFHKEWEIMVVVMLSLFSLLFVRHTITTEGGRGVWEEAQACTRDGWLPCDREQIANSVFLVFFPLGPGYSFAHNGFPSNPGEMMGSLHCNKNRERSVHCPWRHTHAHTHQKLPSTFPVKKKSRTFVPCFSAAFKFNPTSPNPVPRPPPPPPAPPRLSPHSPCPTHSTLPPPGQTHQALPHPAPPLALPLPNPRPSFPCCRPTPSLDPWILSYLNSHLLLGTFSLQSTWPALGLVKLPPIARVHACGCQRN